MAEFAYNNTKNASIGRISFQLNCDYYFWLSYKKDIDLYSKLKSAEKLSAELQELMIICQKNLYFI